MYRIVFILLVFVAGLFQNLNAAKPKVLKGSIDLKRFDFKTEALVKLNGDWEFFEGSLIKSYPSLSKISKTYIKVPSAWNKYSVNGKIKDGIGYGSYRVVINKSRDEFLSLLVRDVGSCYKVWVNNKLELEVGELDTLETLCKPVYGKNSIHISNDTDCVEVVIEVANFCQHKGGLKTFIYLIRSSQDNLHHERESMKVYACLGIIIIMGFYFLFLFFLNYRDSASLNFGLFCFDIFIFLIFRTRIVYYFFPDFDWNIGNKIEYISQYMSLPLFYIFFSKSFPKQFRNMFKYTSLVISLSLIGYVLVTDMREFSITLDIFHVILLIYSVLVIIGSVRALINKEEGIIIIFIGLLIFITMLVNDVLHVQNIINTDNYLIYGILGFIICQALFLALKSARSNTKIFNLSENLAKLNQSLEYFVPSDFLKLLNKKNITEVGLGNSVEKEMTIMFSDIRAFTSISEKLSPKESFGFINEYFKSMAPIIRNHHGFIDKYLGDGIMALFPRSADDALLAGKAMMEELTKFNAENVKAHKPEIAIGIGLHTGSCILGTVGEPKRMDTTVIADAVNLAARIEALTKFYKTPFIISEETHNQIGSELRTHMRFIGEAKVKGKSITTELYKVFLDHKYDMALLDKFDKGIEDFYNKKFKEASEIFKQLSSTDLNDGILEFYIKLSEKYSNQELPEDWKIFQMFEY
ncbi:MAG: adenylate/guanylate cyclase domain-containing protein [Bacteroidia bacterium]